MEEVLHVYRYPLIESMGFDTDIYDGFEKMRAATILGEIVRLHQCTKNTLKYVHNNSKYGHLVSITASNNQESFSRAVRDKVWLDEILLIFQIERRKIKWPWNNTCQSICLRNTNVKKNFPLLNVGCL